MRISDWSSDVCSSDLAIVDTHEQLVLDIGARVEVELQIIVGREDVHPRVAGVGRQGDGAAVGAIYREGVLRVRLAVGIMGIIFKVAVAIAGLEAELDSVGKAVSDRHAPFPRTTSIAVPAGLA